MRISEITRRGIVDAILIERVDWSGRLAESAFLSRLFDLQRLPSKDFRYSNAAGDIWQHRVSNDDWADDWVFHDSRFKLLDGDDDAFLQFLCETIHPVVRPDVTEAERLCQLYNQYIKNDGFELVEKTRISGKPVFVGRFVGVVSVPGVAAAREALPWADAGYVARMITRMETAVNDAPEVAIGTAKELVETCCKTILSERDVEISRSPNLPRLVRLTCEELRITPDGIPEQAKASETIKRLLGNFAQITQGLAELRGPYGTGHGREATAPGLSPRHAKLAVGAASTLAVFLVETHKARPRE